MDEERAPGSLRWLAAGVLAYGVCHLSLLPGRVLVFNDDFAYLRNIERTLSSGRLTTHDFLEPFAALLTLLSSLLFVSTDNLYLSTYGLLVASALLNFFLVHRLFSKRLAPAFNALLSFALCTAPIYLGKSLEFGAQSFFISLFLSALLLYPRQGKLGFFVVTFLAFSLRQTGILLLALPVYELLENLLRRRSVDWGRALQVAATGVACVALAVSMNPTFAREVNAERMLSGFDAMRFLTKVELGLLLCVAFVSSWHFFLNRFSSDWLRRRGRHLAAPVVLTLLCMHVYLQGDMFVFVETPIAISDEVIRWLNEILSLWILVSIWAMDYSKFRGHRVLFLMGCWIMVLALREVWWDYYLTGLFVLSGVWVVNLESTPRHPRPKALVALAVVLILNLHHAVLFKEQLDRTQLRIEIYEELLRDGRLEVNELQGAPFGYRGWKLYDYFMENDAESFAKDRSLPPHMVISGFRDYQWKNRVMMVFGPSSPRDGVEVLAAGKRRIGFRVTDWKLLRRNGKPPKLSIDSRRFEHLPYPLTNREWSELLNASRIR